MDNLSTQVLQQRIFLMGEQNDLLEVLAILFFLEVSSDTVIDFTDVVEILTTEEWVWLWLAEIWLSTHPHVLRISFKQKVLIKDKNVKLFKVSLLLKLLFNLKSNLLYINMGSNLHITNHLHLVVNDWCLNRFESSINNLLNLFNSWSQILLISDRIFISHVMSFAHFFSELNINLKARLGMELVLMSKWKVHVHFENLRFDVVIFKNEIELSYLCTYFEVEVH